MADNPPTPDPPTDPTPTPSPERTPSSDPPGGTSTETGTSSFDPEAAFKGLSDAFGEKFGEVSGVLTEIRDALKQTPTPPAGPLSTPAAPTERKDPRSRLQRGWFGKLRL